MAEETTRRGKFTRDFKDEGTGKSYKKDASANLPEGVFNNYVAAGLVKDPDADKADTASKPAKG